VPGAQRYYPKGQGDPSAPKQPGTGNEAMIDQALRGSNTSDLATGNASGKVGVGEQTAAAGGERFGIEKPDRPYASQLRELGPLSGRVQSPVGQLGGPVGGMLDAVNARHPHRLAGHGRWRASIIPPARWHSLQCTPSCARHGASWFT
jgi:hypothetical protein